MKVTLITFTEDALTLLLRTKGTRLTHDDDPANWSEEKRAEHLEYMLHTIKSSFEFVSYTFKIEGVTRAFTHQLVRHRHGSYAQQAMRVVDARDFPVQTPPSILNREDNYPRDAWNAAVDRSQEVYGELVDAGIPVQDARGILPTNVETSIMCKFNLRSLHEMAKLRLCTRTQGEMQDVFRSMRDLVLFHHSWAEPFLQVQCVSDGTCAFENYGPKECPVWHPMLDNSTTKMVMKERFWRIRYESAPIAKEGKAQ